MSLLCYTADRRGFMGAVLPSTLSPSLAERRELPAGKEEVRRCRLCRGIVKWSVCEHSSAVSIHHDSFLLWNTRPCTG